MEPLPKYTSPKLTRTDVKHFVSTFNMHAGLRTFSNQQKKCAFSTSFSNHEAAHRWFSMNLDKIENPLVSFTDLVTLFLSSAPLEGPTESSITELLQFEKQQQDETTTAFLQRLMYMAGEKWHHITPYELVTVILKKLPPKVHDYVTRQGRPLTFENITSRVKQFEEAGNDSCSETHTTTQLENEVRELKELFQTFLTLNTTPLPQAAHFHTAATAVSSPEATGLAEYSYDHEPFDWDTACPRPPPRNRRERRQRLRELGLLPDSRFLPPPPETYTDHTYAVAQGAPSSSTWGECHPRTFDQGYAAENPYDDDEDYEQSVYDGYDPLYEHDSSDHE